MFTGSMKESKWLDIGNGELLLLVVTLLTMCNILIDARLHLELSRQPVPATGGHTFLRSTPRRSASLRVKKLTKTHKL